MKIEKISNNQIKFVLTQTDLTERNIKLSELAYGSEKTQALFKEMISTAEDTYGFEVENAPLMIEAVPVSGDGIMIIVSKVKDPSEIENKFNILPASMDERKYIKKIIEDELSPLPIDNNSISIYSFNNLDIACNACKFVLSNYDGESQLYKHEGSYFLVIQNDSITNISNDDFDSLITEFGKKHVSTAVSKAFLMEHSEVIIKANALSVLANL